MLIELDLSLQVGDNGGTGGVSYAAQDTLANGGCQVTAAGAATQSNGLLVIPNTSNAGNDIFCNQRLAPGTAVAIAANRPDTNAPVIQNSPFCITHRFGH